MPEIAGVRGQLNKKGHEETLGSDRNVLILVVDMWIYILCESSSNSIPPKNEFYWMLIIPQQTFN